MRGARVRHRGLVEVVEWPEPVVSHRRELVVQMLEASICGSDVHAVLEGNLHADSAALPGYPGHEGVGVVVESASEQFDVGQLVLTLPPGQLGGCFAERQLLDDQHVLALPDGVHDDPATLRRYLLAQQLGTCIFARKRFWPANRVVEPNDAAVVLGGGSAGQFFAHDLRRLGFEQVFVLDQQPDRVAAAERDGAIGCETDADLRAAVTASGRRARLVVDAIGSDAARQLAVDLAAPGADVALFGISPEISRPAGFDFYAAQMKCLTVHLMVGAQSEPDLVSFRAAIELIHADPHRFDHVSGAVFGLEDVPLAFQKAAHPMPGDGVKTFIHIASATAPASHTSS